MEETTIMVNSEEKRAAGIKKKLTERYAFDTTIAVHPKNPGDIYGDHAILHIIEDDDLDNAKRMLKYVADWFLHPHPNGRELRGESDFAAIRLIVALYEERCYGKLSDDIKNSLKSFFLDNDFSSFYGSENHSIMFRVSRLLASQFYKGEYFNFYKKSAEEIYNIDTKYVSDFINFRAGRGWGEFDSLGYTYEIVLILTTLYNYTDNPVLKNKARMMIDIIMLDMIADSKGDIYGGAHGRSYPQQIIDRAHAGMAYLYRYYFTNTPTSIFTAGLLSDYLPSPIVYEVIQKRKLPYENRERKHLHCCSLWAGENIKWDILAKVTGGISKYTYLCDDYILGAINRQEDYPKDVGDKWYAHHQQHEWELTLNGNERNKIFTHHFAIPDSHSVNNRWTGDCGCCCGSFYANKNTVLAMYNIGNPEKEQKINAYVPLPIFENKILEKNYLFLEYEKLYISLYLSEGYRINKEDEFTDRELICEGSQHAVVLRVEYKEKFESLESFANSIKNKPIVYDKTAKTLSFDGIELRTDGNSENGVENIYPYKKTYDCPFMQSDWDSKIITVKIGGKTVIYDFNTTEVTEN